MLRMLFLNILTLCMFTFVFTQSASSEMAESVAEQYLIQDTEVSESKYAVSLQDLGDAEKYDPYENFNRQVFDFNEAIDTGVLRPLAKGYRAVVPEEARKSIKNFLHNLETPTVLINDMLQGNSSRAGVTVQRFVINSTVGFFGFGDPATNMGYPRHTEDFAQTMATYGVPSGPYIVSPFFGPSSPRHIGGRIVDFATHPLTWYLQDQDTEARLAYGVSEAIVTREELLDILDQTKAESPDYYVTIRNIYRQRRLDEINNGVPSDQPTEYSIDAARDLNLVF